MVRNVKVVETDGSETTWPIPDDLEWHLRYLNSFSSSQKQVTLPAASVVAAYRALIWMPRDRRRRVIRQLRTADLARITKEEKA